MFLGFKSSQMSAVPADIALNADDRNSCYFTGVVVAVSKTGKTSNYNGNML